MVANGETVEKQWPGWDSFGHFASHWGSLHHSASLWGSFGHSGVLQLRPRQATAAAGIDG